MSIRFALFAIASLNFVTGTAFASDRSIAQLTAEIVQGLPIVAQFEEALAARDQGRMEALKSEDFHVISRANYDDKLSLDALIGYVDGCKSAGRMSSNGASITITHECPKYEYRYVLYNLSDGKIRRVVIGKTPGLTIERKN